MLNFYFDCFFFSSVAILIPPPPTKKKMFCSYVFEKHDLKTTQNTIRGGRVHFCAFFGATFLQTAVCIPVLAGHPAQGAANSLFLLLLFWKYFLFFSSTKLLYKTLHTHVTYHYTNIKKKKNWISQKISNTNISFFVLKMKIPERLRWKHRVAWHVPDPSNPNTRIFSFYGLWAGISFQAGGWTQLPVVWHVTSGSLHTK